MKKETDMYVHVKALLEKMEYVVYSEVMHPRSTRRADVVGRKDSTITVVEMKTSLSMDLIEQAYLWQPYANHTYIAIPLRKRHIPLFVDKVLGDLGIGVIEVSNWGARITKSSGYHEIRGHIDWNEVLLPEHQTFVEGGTSGGGYVTPYRLTMVRIQEFMSDKDWITVKEILEHCKTHYSSPRGSLTKALLSFEKDWCESKKVGGKWMFKHRS